MTLELPHFEKRVSLKGISWELYQHMLSEIGDGSTRLTYDEGRLEIMAPSGLHEQVKKVLARLIEAYCDGKNIKLEGLGSTTFDRERLRKGLEPDECYYIQNASRIVGKEDFDWEIDPPPDLAIEVDISRPDVARQPIYAALGVTEIWRYDGQTVTPLRRIEDTTGARYIAIEKSVALPDLPMAEVNRLLVVGLKSGQSAAVSELREWMKANPG
ncbi:MAG TPA: Uma2 family endonuclease [Tepidisphaeraceae bacterium]|jgi:Uma2 family endonuclease|nr:Uma2 family endonuclease [Tepidisphaeraceae bacterium]